ncbi:MAG: cytochrome c [Longimicrobiales bacterium]|nr:cytochrome c [Longimicrobiales bacterium]
MKRSIVVWTLTLLVLVPGALAAQSAQATATTVDRELHLFDAEEFGIDPAEVTYTKDIAPILQRSCMNCHREGGAAPMAFDTYEQVRPWAQMIKFRTAIRDRMGAMPPWYVEKDIGIQHYKQDPSLSDEELARIQAWVDNGAPEGDPADLPPQKEFAAGDEWRIDPDVIVESEEIFMEGGAPDWWGEIPSIPIPLEEDRYVKAVEIREINDVPAAGSGKATVGGRFIVHHMIWRTQNPETGQTTSWPVHEVGRNPDLFDDDAGRLLRAGSEIASESVHLHSSGVDTRARLQIGFELFPKGYEPKYEGSITALANGSDIDVEANEDDQELHAYSVVHRPTKIISFEPHLHAPGERMCLEMIWGFKSETLSCVGYDHNWVRTYVFADDYQPLVPPGAILHVVGYFDNTEANANVPDPRNWQGSGNRSVSNMFIDLGERVTMTPEQFAEEVEERVEKFGLTKNDYMIGCPMCLALVPTPGPKPSDSYELPDEERVGQRAADETFDPERSSGVESRANDTRGGGR